MEYIPGSLTGTLKQKEYVPGSLSGTSRITSKQLESSDGLYNLAIQNGLQKEADKILKQQTGEETKKIFSGGFISDIFDVLNAAQYGVVGILKGKGFSEGVKTRQSFSDQDALGDKGLPGVIGGILLDIAVDPLTYIAPYTLIKKVPALGKAVKASEALVFGKKVTKVIEGTEKTYEALEGGTKAGKYLAQKFSWMFGADPIFRETFEKGVKNTAVSVQIVTEMVKPITNLSPRTASKILTRDETGRFIRTPLDGLKGVLAGKEFRAVKNIYKKIDDLGKEAVDLGLLGKEKYEENLGEYIKNAYTEFEQANAKKLFGTGRVGIKGIKRRKDLTPEMLKELGQIDNPAYLLFKSMMDLTKDVENAKLLKQISQKFGTEVAQDGFSKIPSTIKYGDLAGKYIPNNMKEYLTEIISPDKNTLNKQIVANFKYFKVVMNPGTHARNIISNKILNWWKLGMNPLDPRVIKSDSIAVKEIFKGAGNWTDEARPLGFNVDTFISAELKNALLNSPEANLLGKGRKGWETMKKKLGDIYQAEENYAKLSAYIFNRTSKGLSPEEAWKLAESATFNYAQVTPFVRKLRESLFGFPFITFCVSPDTEILTQNGWKIFDMVDIKNDLTLAYDVKTKELKWQKIEDVFVFPYVGKMVSIKSRSLDILMTPDHRNVIERTLHRRKTKEQTKKEIIIDTANHLTKADSIIVAGNYIAPKEKTIQDELVELVGWFVTEGYLVKKYNAMFIGQTNKEGQKKIEELRIKLGVEKYHISLRKYKLGGYKLHKVYYFPAKIRDEVLKLAPNKELRVEFLRKLNKEQLELLYQTILLADGHNPINKKSNPVIIQNNGITANSIQILGVMLGKQFGWTKHDNGLGITVTKGYKRQLKRNMPQRVDYAGIVWCPKTELGTWVARRNGKIFITGNTIKSTPIVLETAIKAPHRISAIGKIKNSIENLSDIKETDREKASQPPWIKNGFYIKLPIKDSEGRSAYFDLTYILPFGDLLAGNFLERNQNLTTGLPESHIEALMKKSPFIQVVSELGKNKDFYGNSIWKNTDSSEKQLGDLMRHLSKTYLPPLVGDQLPGGYNSKGERQWRGITGSLQPSPDPDQKRTLAQELLRNVGAKIQPIDVDIQETYAEWNKKKALQNLLLENGVGSNFQRFYIPKEEEEEEE